MSNDQVIGPFSGDHRFLSNFWDAPVQYGQLLYPTSEHAYQAAKSLSRYRRRQISELETPGMAKKAGQELDVRPDWDHVKIRVMRDILNIKFSGAKLSSMLLATDDTPIVELNHWHDMFWGVCTCDQHQGRGSNNLGHILMQIREELKSAGALLAP